MKPEAADSLGVNVAAIRYACISFGGVMAGIAGASLSIALINLFQENMTSGLGFIAVALVYFGAATLGAGKSHPHSGRYCGHAALYFDHSGVGVWAARPPARGIKQKLYARRKLV
jgi:ribose/xylose/arabinose/galactoside ABC-type transport system permease subunit